MEKDRKGLQEAQMRITALEEDLKRFAGESEQLEKKHAKEEKALEAILESLKGDIGDLQAQLATAQEELAPFSKARDEAKAACDLKQAELDLVTKGVRDIDAQIEAAETGSKEVSGVKGRGERCEEKQREPRSVLIGCPLPQPPSHGVPRSPATIPLFCQALETASSRSKELKVLEKRHGDATSTLKKRKAELATIAGEEEPLQVKVKSARAKVEESRAASRQARSSGQVLEALRRQAKRGAITGFHGRLGDLGTIDDKYDVAVTTACGALNHLVVETVAQAQHCVEFLRKNNVGRATFIILERIQGLATRASQPFACPSGALRLFDLVQPKDAKFAVAFYHALQDTLVADDLDQATAIAFSVGAAVGRRCAFLQKGGQIVQNALSLSRPVSSFAEGPAPPCGQPRRPAD